MSLVALPRVTIAGMAGDTGKSLVSLGLVRGLVDRGHAVAPFKKGPDFIDAAWLGAAARAPGRNLDTFLMPHGAVVRSLLGAGAAAELAIIEGNRGLFDGADASGTHSTAQLARRLGTPVILVVDVTKATRTVAAQVLGCRALDPALQLAGVILNRVGTARQEAVIREAVIRESCLPVLGAVPRLESLHLPSRHLGLVPVAESPEADEILARVAEVVAAHVDIAAVRAIARRAADLPVPAPEPPRYQARRRVRIAVLRDAAFSFYYPENLEALSACGAELVPTSPLADAELPAVDAVYAGGGFPEEHAARLAANDSFRLSLARAAGEGMPVWAECGGLMYLACSLERDGERHPMVGALPIDVTHTPRPRGHGYVVGRVDGANPFLDAGLAVTGHEFHYSCLGDPQPALTTVLALERGVGVGGGRDGVRVGNTVATYAHVHALGVPEWAPALVRAAEGRP